MYKQQNFNLIKGLGAKSQKWVKMTVLACMKGLLSSISVCILFITTAQNYYNFVLTLYCFTVITGFETENKYRIRNSVGQQVYFAAEGITKDVLYIYTYLLAESNCCLRQYCGPSRPFAMAITDNSGAEVIHLERPMRCTCFCCFCCLQEMEVQSPPGTVIGYVKQK